MALALELGDLELEMRNHGLIIRRLGARSGGISDRRIALGFGDSQSRLQCGDINRKGCALSFHERMESQNRSLEAPLNASSQKFMAMGLVQPAACGRQVRCGMRQSIPSRR